MAPYFRDNPTAVPTIVPKLEPSKRIHRMVELSRQAGMAEADVTKVRYVSAAITAVLLSFFRLPGGRFW